MLNNIILVKQKSNRTKVRTFMRHKAVLRRCELNSLLLLAQRLEY